MKTIKCPFCGRDITTNYSLSKSIYLEVSLGKHYQPVYTWTGSFMKVTKYTKIIGVYCCSKCYNENLCYTKWMKILGNYIIPASFIGGIIYFIIIANKGIPWYNYLIGCPLCGIIGAFIVGVPLALISSLFEKRTKYKKALECNAIID